MDPMSECGSGLERKPVALAGRLTRSDRRLLTMDRSRYMPDR